MLFNDDNYEVKLSIFFDNIMWYYYLKKEMIEYICYLKNIFKI